MSSGWSKHSLRRSLWPSMSVFVLGALLFGPGLSLAKKRSANKQNTVEVTPETQKVSESEPPPAQGVVSQTTVENTATRLRILSPANGFASLSDSVSILFAVAVAPGSTVLQVAAELDGRVVAQQSRPQPTDRGIVPSLPTLKPGEAAYRLSVTLPEGNTQLAVRVQTDRETVSSPVLTIGRLPRSSANLGIKPRLNVLAVGISSYVKREMNLVYPQKDASDLATVFKQQEGKLYREVNTRILVNDDANKAAILDGLDWLQRQTTAHDMAVMFFAGHGINDPSTGRYYFLPHDADPNAIKRTMLAQEEVQSTLRSIPGKVLLFLDTCHAGNIMGQWNLRGDADLDGFIREMNTAESGVVVFAASTGRQSSKESAAWQNGAFTRALVEGLLGAAAYIQDRPVTVNMLDLFLSERVKALTNGTQTPTTAKPSNLQDFPIASPDKRAPPLSDAAMKVMPSLVKLPRPVYKKAWLWTTIGISAVGLVTIGVVVGTWQAVPSDYERLRLAR